MIYLRIPSHDFELHVGNDHNGGNHDKPVDCTYSFISSEAAMFNAVYCFALQEECN